MAQVIWTEPALQELDRIADYIALDKPDAARRLVGKIFDRVAALAEFPDLGSCPKELSGDLYRQLVIAPVRVIYRVENSRVYVVYALRGEKLLHREDFDD